MDTFDKFIDEINYNESQKNILSKLIYNFI